MTKTKYALEAFAVIGGYTLIVLFTWGLLG